MNMDRFQGITGGLLLVIVLQACGGGSGDNALLLDDGLSNNGTAFSAGEVEACSAIDMNRWVYRAAQDYYYWYDLVPTLDPDTFDSPVAVLNRIRAPDDPYSYLTTTERYNSTYEDNTSFHHGGYGIRDGAIGWHILHVYKGSPFDAAGVQRGEYITAINDIPWLETDTRQRWEMYGSEENPLEVKFQIWNPINDQYRTVNLMVDHYVSRSVMHSETFTLNNRSVAYLMLENFAEYTNDELTSTFAEFARNDADTLILDLRYNSGGRIDVARWLSSLIGGTAVSGRPQMNFEYNDKYTLYNEYLNFRDSPFDLSIDEVIVLVSQYTASASELTVKMLEPYLDITVIGTDTRGKAFFSQADDYCGMTLNLIRGVTTNWLGQSALGGLDVDCLATDTRIRPWGYSNGMDTSRENLDGMFAAALDYLEYGHCAGTVVAARSRAPMDGAENEAAPGLDAESVRPAGSIRAEEQKSALGWF